MASVGMTERCQGCGDRATSFVFCPDRRKPYFSCTWCDKMFESAKHEKCDYNNVRDYHVKRDGTVRPHNSDGTNIVGFRTICTTLCDACFEQKRFPV